jgi:hypothetical protein
MKEERPVSETPRTDSAAIEASGHCESNAEGQAVVGIEFARQLERALAQSQARCAELEQLYELERAARDENVTGWQRRCAELEKSSDNILNAYQLALVKIGILEKDAELSRKRKP